jgi:hypothetical protein
MAIERVRAFAALVPLILLQEAPVIAGLDVVGLLRPILVGIPAFGWMELRV